MFDNSLSMDPVLTSFFNAMTTSFDVVDEEVGGSLATGCRAQGVAPTHCSCQSCLLRKLANAGKEAATLHALLRAVVHLKAYSSCAYSTYVRTYVCNVPKYLQICHCLYLPTFCWSSACTNQSMTDARRYVFVKYLLVCAST